MIYNESTSYKLFGKTDKKLIDFILHNPHGVNLPFLLRVYCEIQDLDPSILEDRKTYMKLYMRLYRFIKNLESKGLVTIFKSDGLVWVKATVDLISTSVYTRKIQTPQFRRIHPKKLEAIHYLMERKSLEFDDWFELSRYLFNYISDVSKRVILLKNVQTDDLLLLHYKHRFIKKEIKKKIKEYEKLWENNYDVGVFLTLTMDPNKYPNLLEATKRISKCLNRFMSYLYKRLGNRPPYVNIFEPMDSGNPHLHLVIFGIPRIEDHYKLTKILTKEGFGMVHYEYKIRKCGNTWVWAHRKHRPKNCRTNDVKAYLKKYLIKTLFFDFEACELQKMKISFYFATNKRFFTCSRSLLRLRKKQKIPNNSWLFIGSFHLLDLPDFIFEYLESRGLSIVWGDIGTWILVPVLAEPQVCS